MSSFPIRYLKGFSGARGAPFGQGGNFLHDIGHYQALISATWTLPWGGESQGSKFGKMGENQGGIEEFSGGMGPDSTACI